MPTVVVLCALELRGLLGVVPALRAVRRAYPSHRLVLAAPGPLADLVPLVGAADELMQTSEAAEFRWCGPPPDTAVNLHGPGPQSTEVLLAAQPGRLVSHACPELPGVRGPRWQPGDHETHRWCHLLRWFGMAAEPHDILLHRPPDCSYPLGSVLLHPGTAEESRSRPVAWFAAVGRALAADGHHVEVVGGPGDLAIAEAVADSAGLPVHADAAGRAGLRDLAAMISAARLVVCGDIGIARLAAAYATPSLYLSDAAPTQAWGPPASSRHRVLWPNDPHGRGFDAIGVSEVLGTARALLTASPAPFADPYHAGRIEGATRVRPADRAP